MKCSRPSEEQIIGILEEHEAGVSVADVCLTHGVSRCLELQLVGPLRRMDVFEARRLKALEDENTRLKRASGRRHA